MLTCVYVCLHTHTHNLSFYKETASALKQPCIGLNQNCGQVGRTGAWHSCLAFCLLSPHPY